MKRNGEFGKRQHLWLHWLPFIHIHRRDDGKLSVTQAGPLAAEFLHIQKAFFPLQCFLFAAWMKSTEPRTLVWLYFLERSMRARKKDDILKWTEVLSHPRSRLKQVKHYWTNLVLMDWDGISRRILDGGNTVTLALTSDFLQLTKTTLMRWQSVRMYSCYQVWCSSTTAFAKKTVWASSWSLNDDFCDRPNYKGNLEIRKCDFSVPVQFDTSLSCTGNRFTVAFLTFFDWVLLSGQHAR